MHRLPAPPSADSRACVARRAGPPRIEGRCGRACGEAVVHAGEAVGRAANNLTRLAKKVVDHREDATPRTPHPLPRIPAVAAEAVRPQLVRPLLSERLGRQKRSGQAAVRRPAGPDQQRQADRSPHRPPSSRRPGPRVAAQWPPSHSDAPPSWPTLGHSPSPRRALGPPSGPSEAGRPTPEGSPATPEGIHHAGAQQPAQDDPPLRRRAARRDLLPHMPEQHVSGVLGDLPHSGDSGSCRVGPSAHSPSPVISLSRTDTSACSRSLLNVLRPSHTLMKQPPAIPKAMNKEV